MSLVFSRLFTQTVFNELLNTQQHRVLDTIVDRYIDVHKETTYRDILEKTYQYMHYNYRNEYFYLNTLFNKLLLGRHSINTTSALTQLGVNKSKADFVMINGKGVVYEIKTELDSFERLESQINDYYKGFTCVYVVTSPKQIEALGRRLEGMPVGIIELTNRTTLKIVKEAMEDNSQLEHDVLFKMLNKKEWEHIILKEFNSLPQASQFDYYKATLQRFREIPIDIAYSQTLKQLKGRNSSQKEDIDNVPYALKFLVYLMGLNKKRFETLELFLDSLYRG